MRPKRLYRINIVGLHKEKQKVLDFLQEAGVFHVRPVEEIEVDHKLDRDSPLEITEKISTNLLELKWMMETLKDYSPLKIKQKEFRSRDVKESLEETEKIRKEIKDDLIKSVETFNRNEELNKEAETKISLLKKIPFDLDKDSLMPYSGRVSFLLLVRKEMMEKDEENTSIKEILMNSGDKQISDEITVFEKGNFAFLQGYSKHKEEVEKIIRDVGLSIINIHLEKKTKREEIERCEKELKIRREANHKIEKDFKKKAKTYFKKICELREELEIFHDRYEISNSFMKTHNIFFVQGFISKKDYKNKRLDGLKKIAKIDITAEEVTDGPTKIENQRYVKHFEFITKMFGLPKYDGIDPTLYLSIFIPLFFGFMFSDMGYGLMLLAASIFMLKKSSKKTPILADAGIVLLTSAVSTITFGALFGAFFGNLFGITPLLFDPFLNAKNILLISLAIGLVHINLGLLISAFEMMRTKQLKKFSVTTLPLFLLQAGCVLLALQSRIIGYVLIAVSIALLISEKSLMGLMDITGFAGTWFSYARLLALSLATGGIALGVNIMADQLNSIKFIGPILFIILLIFGHAFNFVINVLGSSIHSVRLHYIEFFSQFYEGGGKEFKPFTTKRVKDSI